MFFEYLERGAKAGLVAGLVNGLFVAVVGNNFVAGLETFEHGHEAPAVPAWTTDVLSVLGGVLWGLLFGLVVFGVGYYLLEPALPGTGAVRRFVLAGVGFMTVSGVPWLVLPPQPPGVEQALGTDVRLALYAVAMVLGALVAALAVLAYRRYAERGRGVALVAALVPFALLVPLVVAAPENAVHGDVPGALVVAFQGTVVFGQVLLWAVLATAHAWLDGSDGGGVARSPAPAVE